MVVEGYEGSLLFSLGPIEMDCRSYSWGNRSSRLLGAVLEGLGSWSERTVLLTDMQTTLPPLPLPTILLPPISTNLTPSRWSLILKNLFP